MDIDSVLVNPQSFHLQNRTVHVQYLFDCYSVVEVPSSPGLRQYQIQISCAVVKHSVLYKTLYCKQRPVPRLPNSSKSSNNLPQKQKAPLRNVVIFQPDTAVMKRFLLKSVVNIKWTSSPVSLS